MLILNNLAWVVILPVDGEGDSLSRGLQSRPKFAVKNRKAAASCRTPRNSALLPDKYSTTGSTSGQEGFCTVLKERFAQGVNEYVGIEKDSIAHSSRRACRGRQNRCA